VSDDIEFSCPHCETVSAVPSAYAGKRGKCPNCKQVIEVPDPYELADEPEDKGRSVGGPVGDDSEKECPFCGEYIKTVAKKCKHCGEFLDRRLRQKNTRPKRRPSAPDEMQAIDWVLCIFCAGIGCILGLVYLSQGQSKRGGTMVGLSIAMAVFWNVVQFLIAPKGRY